MVDNGLKRVHRAELRRHLLQQLLPERALPIRLTRPRVAAMLRPSEGPPGRADRDRSAGQTVTGPDGKTDRFEIDPFRKECLLKGVDEVDLTLGYEHKSPPSRRVRRQR